MIDTGDGTWQYYNTGIRTAKKVHRCGECYREIQPKEKYHWHSGLWEGRWGTAKICQHCTVAAEWLQTECGGFLFTMVDEDLREHFYEGHKNVGRVCVGIKRQWKKFKSNELMGVPSL